MSPSALAASLLIGVLTLLAPLAQASPPDPLWIGGVFDASDLDDVVAVAASADGATAPHARESAEALWAVVGAVSWADSMPALPSMRPSFQGRAPPNIG
jgi:hypothetical protein